MKVRMGTVPMLSVVSTAVVLIGVVNAHDRHFPDHPEWNDIWPDPVTLNDLGKSNSDPDALRPAGTPPDLSGVWTGSPAAAANSRYFFTPSGGGYGSSKDRAFANEPPAAPGMAWDVRCITEDYTQKAAVPCGWDRARAVISPAQHYQQAISVDASIKWTATITFYKSGDPYTSLSGAVTDNAEIAMRLPWRHLTGKLTGLWRGPTGDDIYVVTHNATSNALTVWWDESQSHNPGGWYKGDGTFDPATNVVDMRFDSFEISGVADPPNFDSIGNGQSWGDPWTRRPALYPHSDIHTVHLIFMNHLDIGYTTSINNVLNEYLHAYYQRVERLSDEMRANGTDRFIYTTHPWLMSLLLDCPCPSPADAPNATCTARSLNVSADYNSPPLQCASAEEIAKFKSAVAMGDIVWHAAPMNNQFENQSPALVEAGIKMTRMFDSMFYGNGSNDQKTITMSDRDVIYVTRSMIPFLSKYGVEALTIGSNDANYPPQVPKLHVWRDEQSDTDVIVVYHPYGYGGYGKSTCAGPGMCGDCAEAPNGVAICTEFRTDNTGPPQSIDEVITSLNAVRAEYPGAKVLASTFDNFIREIRPVKDKLPVVTKEVGDTWMYGSPSDPLKMAQSRELQRVWEECLAREENAPVKDNESSCEWSRSAAIRNMTRFLMKAPEHTWGTPGISGWGGGGFYNKSLFTPALKTAPFMHAASSWAEQRIYNALAVAALEHAGHPLAGEARARYEAVSHAAVPSLTGLTKVADPRAVVDLGATFKIAFDGTGAIAALSCSSSATQWASATRPLAALVYQTLNESDWLPFTYDYVNGHSESGGFCKKGSNNFTVSKHWRPILNSVYASHAGSTVLAHMTMPTEASSRYGGAFTEAYLNVTSVKAGQLSLELTLIGKTPTMIGESTMLSFAPAPQLKTSGAWSISKLGHGVDPEEVINGGNQFNHGAWDGGSTVTTASGEQLQLVSLDASNMCPQTADFPWGNPLPAGSDGLLQLKKGSVFGMGVNLHNNLWNTNYPTFYPFFDKAQCTTPTDCKNADSKFRFVLNLSGPQPAQRLDYAPDVSLL